MLNLLFPRVCMGCAELLLQYEKILCSDCRHKIPLASFHRMGDKQMLNRFYGRFPVVNATSLIQFQKQGISQEILHNLKYRGQKEISAFFGKWLGAELAETPGYNEIEMVIPVPLHKQKLKKRGYNQVEGFGIELAKSLKVPYRDDILLKVSKSRSQVFKSRILRFEVEEVFTLQHKEDLNQKHLLLVDDIITTGATLEKCALQLLKAEGVRLSIATIAIA